MMRPLAQTTTACWFGCVVGLLPTSIDARQVQAAETVTRPVISDDVVPLEQISSTAQDGTRGEGFLRKPPGPGPFPAVVLIHGGITRWPTSQLREYAVSTWPSRFLAAGYVVAVVTYRSRDVDPQSSEAVQDTLAAIEHVRRLPYVDRTSIVVNGVSGGGDLALWAASSTEIAAIVTEEPASSIFMGMFNNDWSRPVMHRARLQQSKFGNERYLPRGETPA
jgi:dipeptidyl aminopeptidase/acylaminoacyl peptidase